MNAAAKTVGAYEGKDAFGLSHKQVAKGKEVVITKKRASSGAIGSHRSSPDKRRRYFSPGFVAMQARLSLGEGKTAKELIEAGRRI